MAQISARQFGMLIFLLRIGLTIVRLPALKLMPKGPDAWLALLIGTVVGAGLVGWVLSEAARTPTLTLQERLDSALGMVPGRIVGWCYLLFFLWDTMLAVRLYSGMLTAQPMPETPPEAFMFMMLAGTAFTAIQGPEVVARMAEVTAPLIIGGIVLVLLLGLNRMDPHALKPVVGYGWAPILRTAVFPAGVQSETLAALLLLPHTKDPRQAARAGAAAATAAGGLSALCAAVLVMFYSSPETRRLVYPLYDMARSITIGDFFERIDALFIIIWSANSFVKLAFLHWATSRGLAQLLGLKGARHLVLPLALLIGLAATRAYGSQAELYSLNSPPVYIMTTGPFLLGFPVLLSGAELLRRWRRRAL